MICVKMCDKVCVMVADLGGGGRDGDEDEGKYGEDWVLLSLYIFVSNFRNT